MTIDNKNIASCGYPNYEFRGTISIDFAGNNLNTIEGLNLNEPKFEGWNMVGLKLGKDLFENNISDKIQVEVILSSYKNGISDFGFVDRLISKKDLLNLMKLVSIQVSDLVHFEKDDISWKDLDDLD